MKKLLLIILLLSVFISWSQQEIDSNRTSNFIEVNGTNYYISTVQNVTLASTINSVDANGTVTVLGNAFFNADKLIQLDNDNLVYTAGSFSNSGGALLRKFNIASGNSITISNSSIDFGTEVFRFNNRFYYSSLQNLNIGKELYSSDGNSSSIVEDINTGNGDSEPGNFTMQSANGLDYLIFTAKNSSGASRRLYALSSAANSTPILLATNATSVLRTYAIAGTTKIAFTASGDGDGNELWVLDLIDNTAIKVTDINTSGSSFPQSITQIGDYLYFTARDNGLVANSNLYSYNIISNTVAAINTPGVTYNNPSFMSVIDNELYFYSLINTSNDRRMTIVNGTNLLVVSNSQSNASYFYKLGSYVYYREITGFTRYNPINGNIQDVSNSGDIVVPRPVFDLNGSLFVRDENSIPGLNDLRQLGIFTEHCDIPLNVIVSNNSSTYITFDWDNNSSAANGYDTVEVLKDDDPNTQAILSGNTNLISTTIDFSDLNPGTEYDFYVRSNCSSTISSDWSAKLTFITFLQCDAPTNVTTSNITLSSLDISWSGSATAVNGYRWYVVPQGQGIGSFIEANNTTNTTVNVNASNLSSNTSYDVYVESLCSLSPSVTELSQVHTFSTPISCEAPDTISLSGLSATSNTFFLSWAVSNDAVNGYAWYILPTGYTDLIGAIESGTTPSSSSTFVVVNATNLIAGATYDAVVVSLCSSSPNVDSGFTGLVTFTAPTPCVPPTNITTSNFSVTDFTISWTAIASASNGYNWYVVNSGAEGIAAPIASGSVGAGITSVITAASSLTLNNSYDVYVESICTVGTVSDLSVVHTFLYTTLGINDFELNSIALYPNPSNSNFAIKGLTGEAKIKILDITGKTIVSIDPYLDAKIDITKLKSGLYIVEVLNETSSQTLKLLVD